MKEFQAENDRRRTSDENNSTMLLNVDSNERILQSTSNDQSIPSTPTKQFHLNQMKTNTPERRSNVDRNKLNIKTNRFTYDTLKV
jgi:hypothetical protein